MPKHPLIDSLSVPLAKARQKFHSNPILRFLGRRGALTLLLGAALSMGGLTETLDGVHFLVEKNLDSVRVVREDPGGSRVVATLDDGFAANSIFKLSRALPEGIVAQRRALFDEGWLARQNKRDVFTEEMARVNEGFRREFFANGIPYGDLIHEKSEKYEVDPALVAAVMEAESHFREGARSQVGARGLMQLMPRTGRWMGARDLYNPEQNVDAGVRYIKYLQQQFGGNLKKTIAAYNAGEGNVRRYNGVPPFGETQTYVRKVLWNYNKRHEELKHFGEGQTRGESVAEPDGTVTLQ